MFESSSMMCDSTTTKFGISCDSYFVDNLRANRIDRKYYISKLLNLLNNF